MAGEVGNPNIAEAGKATQFGQKDGPDPAKVTRGGSAAWSVRGAVRRFGASDIDLSKDEEVEKFLGRKPTNSEKTAIKQFLKSHSEDADTRAAEFVDERIEGKLPQTNINSELEKLMKMTDDELRSFLARITNGLSEAPADGSGGGAGNETPRDGDTSAGATGQA